MNNISRQQLKKYRDVISMWLSRYDTCEIAAELQLPEFVVASWLANFRDVANEAAA